MPTPLRGRGRGRGRGRDCREVNAPGIQQQFSANPAKQEGPSENEPPIVERNPEEQPRLPSPGNDGESPVSAHRTRQEKFHKERGQATIVRPEDLGFQLKRKLAITPRRPGEGTLGKRIKLISNCYPLKVPGGNIYHYDVGIRKRNVAESEEKGALVPAGVDKKYRCLNTKKNREIISLMLSTEHVFTDSYAAYDGQKNLFTRNPLHAIFPIKCTVVLPHENCNPEDPRQDTYEVEIKPVIKKETESCIISLDAIHSLFDANNRTTSVPQEAVMALETILRHGPCLRFTPVGRSFFYPPDPGNLHPLGGGLEIWFGYHQSVRLGQWGPMVNLDLTATTFLMKGPVICYIAELMNVTVGELRRRPLLPNTDIRRIGNKLKNMRIEVTHLRNYRRKYRILRLVKESANRLEFELTENGRTVKKTVARYFRERYNRNLEFPNLPCLQVYPEGKKTYLPIEVCEFVEGQHSKTKLESRQKSEMIKFTALAPKDRFSEIGKITNAVDINDRFVRGFELEVSPEPLHLQGRVLDSPGIRYKDKVVKPKDGAWTLRQTQFLRGATVESWVLLSLTNVDNTILNRFADLLMKIGQETGISISFPKLTQVIDISRCDLESLFSGMKTKYKADLAVIIIPTKKDALLYGRIKKAAETAVGLATQCIRENNVTDPRKCTPQLITNLCQKINSKLGGENNSLVPAETPVILRTPVIIIGADVNHPGPSTGVKPSLAACVGSLDRKLSRYAVSIKAQNNVDEKKQAVEIICELKSMVVDLLKAFYRNTRLKPEKIIFYRDGVSEGQFEKVRHHEVRSIREACKSLGPDYEPGITFIVVQKRHHVRFMPQDERDGVGRMKNVPAGTTVDTVVTHPVNFDYYLCSQFGGKGSARGVNVSIPDTKPISISDIAALSNFADTFNTGTSRPSHYTVLEDDNDFTPDDIQKLSYQLCHTYARCTRSISIPVPVAYADLAAYRARHHLDATLEESTSSSDSSASDVVSLSQSVVDAIKVIKGLENAMYFI